MRDSLEANAPAETVRGAVEALSEALQKAGSAVYGQPGEDGAAEGGPPPEGDSETPPEEEAVEGEYREV